MLVFMIQWGGSRYHPGPVNLLQPLLLIAVSIVSGVLIGWRADITVFEHPGGGSEGATGPDRLGRDRVRLRWTELRDAAGAPAVSRELRAPTVAGALEAMVADRRTDQTLEAIEQGAVFNGVRWPEDQP
ncbi:MAG TPA: hypothetical protein VFN55_04580 [Solirubrobacteraceae bacterium]|nr:hypothetical protein [Solirubrobacteraceae bacterium]